MQRKILRITFGFILFIVFISWMYACTNAEENGALSKKNEIFKNVTEKAGLSYMRDSFSHCWGDINGDGLPDLFIINHFQRPFLFRNNGSGAFEDITVNSGINIRGDQHGCAIADYDNDGDKDIFVTIGADQGRGSGSKRLYQNNGKGIFTDIAVQAGVDYPLGRGRTVSWVDYNNDGLLDLLVGNGKRKDTSTVLFKNMGNGFISNANVESGLNYFNESAGRASWIDYDNDGFMDLVIVKAKSHNKNLIEIYKNSRGVFKKTKTLYGGTYAWGDYDNDGDMDIFITVPPRYYMFKIEYEFNLLAKIFHGFNKLYENQGNGTFVDVTSKAGFRNEHGGDQPVLFDYDNDGDLDIYLLISGTKKENINDMIFENNGNKTFSNVTNKIGLVQHFSGRGNGVAYCDYDGNGFLDLFLTNGLDRGGLVWGRDSGPYVLYKNIGNDNHWLNIKLIGKVSNRDGIGARVKLYIGKQLQYQQNSGGMEGYVQHGTPIHFGLGKATNIDKIEIMWPSGVVTNMTNVKPDQYLVVEE